MLKKYPRLLTALALASASLLPNAALALSVGEAQVLSSLSQPLRAQIDLQGVRDLGPEELKVRLASPEAFKKAGIERDGAVLALQFETKLNAKGQSMIRVTSSRPITEPYLNFLVEVVSPDGLQLREYSLLIDPPNYAFAAPAPVSAPVASVAPAVKTKAPVAAPAVAAASATSAAPVAAATPSASSTADGPVAGGQYRTRNNDRLWDIAQAIRGDASPHQAMLAIQRMNPDAFNNGDINRMKTAQNLQLPNREQLHATGRTEALAQLDARKRSEAGSAPATPAASDKLSLVGEQGSGRAEHKDGAKGSKAAAKQEADNRLAITQEELAQARREGEELSSRVADLQSQLDKLQRLIVLKDSQLAELTARLAKLNNEAESKGELAQVQPTANR
ncbi:FimV family protein [Pseudomonas sp. GV071]|jgi:pilus assembly protein FimV|uniref:type IV pilus assembly protein FimV n=1 Tax=Pseudomonas sp. GV071 TaxID=2135754 RepID=UPI000D3A6DBD|nr:FimV/HubP family polar landmark protein [Pseudomonas sp. GV071]PTQ73243.1 FimV-like protein [Pseudomonas sp. GV071]